MLGQLDRFVAVGELRHIWRIAPDDFYLCSCGERFSNCSFWSSVIEEAFGSVDGTDFRSIAALARNVDRVRYIPLMILSSASRRFEKEMTSYQDILFKVYRAIKTVSKRDIIVDSSKDVSSLFLLAFSPDVALHTLHLVRDSRAVAYSWLRTKVRPDIVGRVVHMRTYKPHKSSWEWFYRNMFVELSRFYNPAYTLVRYNNLVSKPVETLKLITEKLGETDQTLSFLDGDTVLIQRETHTVSGNPIRFEKNSMRLKLDEEWRQNMRKSDKAIVSTLTWPLLLRYGYSPIPFR
jgi:hypothetical protein